MFGQPLLDWPVWAAVVTCGFTAQVFKLVVYSAAKGHFDLAILTHGRGLPSLQATILTCLLATVVMRSGWTSSQAAFALVFAVIVIHDTVKLRRAASRQREMVYHLVASLPEGGPLHRRVADYLDPRTHQVSHVVVGMLFGALFGLAFGLRSG